MDVRLFSRFIPLLLCALLLGAVAPCGLFEIAAAPFCTEEARAGGTDGEDRGADDHAGSPDADCCAGCLTCCASYTAPASLRAFGPAPASLPLVTPPEDGPPGSPLSIWRPPRI